MLARPELRKKLPAINDRIVNVLLAKIDAKAIPIANVPEEYHHERDPEDEVYVNLAIVTNASYLVTRDDDLLDLMTLKTDEARQFRLRYPLLRILDPADFVREITSLRH